MAEVIRDRHSKVVLLFSTGRVRPVLEDLSEELVTLAELPEGIERHTTTLADDGTLTHLERIVEDRRHELRAAADAHATRCLLLRSHGWLHDHTGAPLPLVDSAGEPTERSERWSNITHRILSAAVVVAEIAASSEDGWGVETAADALAAYRTLIPADPAALDSWYRKHDVDAWTQRRTGHGVVADKPGYLYAHYYWLPGRDRPDLLADRRHAARWRGDDRTLRVVLPADAATVDDAHSS